MIKEVNKYDLVDRCVVCILTIVCSLHFTLCLDFNPISRLPSAFYTDYRQNPLAPGYLTGLSLHTEEPVSH